MTYQTTITKKGQIVIPKAIRDKLGLEPSQKLSINFDEKNNKIEIKKEETIFDLAGKIKPVKGVSVLDTRKIMEENYERF